MIRKSLRQASSALATLGLAAIVSGAQAAPPVSEPFHAQISTQEVLFPNPAGCPNVLAGHTTGGGVASHMGRVTLDATDCIIPLPGGATFVFNSGKLTLTAANGDRLYADYSGMLLLQPGAAPGTLYTLQGSYTITGGTGRFANATGQGSLNGTEDLRTQQATYQASGTIRYPRH